LRISWETRNWHDSPTKSASTFANNSRSNNHETLEPIIVRIVIAGGCIAVPCFDRSEAEELLDAAEASGFHAHLAGSPARNPPAVEEE
jgi:hypothetical protein